MDCPYVKILLIIFITDWFTPLFSQESQKKEFIRSVHEADISFFYDEDFDKAAALYEPLQQANPVNANLAGKLGICYLNIDGKAPEALRLLKIASKNIVSTEKEYEQLGEKAPFDTYIYLANAYHRNDSLEKAISLYYYLKEKLGESETFKEEYIDNQIRDCKYAKEFKKKPLTIIRNLFAPWLKDYPGACNPVLAKNDSVFIFTQKIKDKTRILCSYKSDKWETPVDITKQLGGYDRFYSNSITGNGKLLILQMDDGGDGNLYFCQRKDTTWTKIKSLGKPINTIYWESHGFITPDGNTIYFSSNRPGGFGELDIWYSVKTENGTWDHPVNCGEIINTVYDEDTPFFDPANNALIFSSKGHVSMGGYDVLRSTNNSSYWTNPVGIPFAFNTTDDNTFFILNNNTPGFVTSLYDQKSQMRNIYSLVAINPSDEITKVNGTVTFKDGMNVEPAKASMKLTDANNKTSLRQIPLNEDGTFSFDIKPGDYQLSISYPGYKTDTINLSLPLYFLSHYMVVNSTLTPEKVAEGTFLTIKNILFEYDSYELDDQAKSELEVLKSILVSYPDLKIEISGYTDSKGSTQYNKILAGKRAQAVIDYLTSPAIPASRFVKKAFGKSHFVAVNVNNDGSDNPEGRKYNRRVAFGIIDPHTGVVIRQETYTPEHLRLASSMKYSLIIKRTKEKLQQDYFDNLELNGMLFIRTIPFDSVMIYAIGVFYNKTDAIKYLAYAKGKGYLDAYVVNQYDLNSVTKSAVRLTPIVSHATGKKIYTIQLKANSRSPMNMSLFKEFKDVREILGEDGYYRYVTGEFDQYSQAKEALVQYIDAGFKDAFIRELNLLIIK